MMLNFKRQPRTKQQALAEIAERLARFDASAFDVKFEQEGDEPIALIISERYSPQLLTYAQQVATLAAFTQQKLKIAAHNNIIYYIIY